MLLCIGETGRELQTILLLSLVSPFLNSESFGILPTACWISAKPRKDEAAASYGQPAAKALIVWLWPEAEKLNSRRQNRSKQGKQHALPHSHT